MKELLLGLGAITAVVAPVVGVVACGGDSHVVDKDQVDITVVPTDTVIKGMFQDLTYMTEAEVNAYLATVGTKLGDIAFGRDSNVTFQFTYTNKAGEIKTHKALVKDITDVPSGLVGISTFFNEVLLDKNPAANLDKLQAAFLPSKFAPTT